MSITLLLSYKFMQYALLGSLIISVLCGIIGSYIVINRKVFIASGIAHASFGGIGLSFLLSIPPLLGASVFSVVIAFCINLITDKLNVREDSAIGIIWSFGMAIGVVALYLTPGYAPNVSSYLFGDILTLTPTDLMFSGIVAICVILFYTLFFKVILYASFDSSYLKAKKIPMRFIEYTHTLFIALTIIASVRLIGIILILALLTIPQTIAALFSIRFKGLILGSVVVTFASCVMGLFVSFWLNVPSGPSIILVLVSMYCVAKSLELMIRWRYVALSK